jgi:hypothetical protein
LLFTKLKPRGASFYADQACCQLLEERQDVTPLQLAPDDHLAAGVNSVNLEDRLVISVALFVVAAFWLWKHMKTGAYVSKRTLRSAEVLIPFLRSPARSHY